MEFDNLGLVIVDEEQRFGVGHKETLKHLRKSVDVLTMTATPIPRTLHMAFAGLRDVSLLQDPPEGRMPVETVISEYREDVVAQAIRAELERGGQVYFLHNRVETLEEVTAHLAQIVPQNRLRVAHGQLEEADLEATMADFSAHQFDILVCTTIIETGVDIPNANTLLVDHADQFGLSQLYQLRGRVGRSQRQAHALFLYQEEGSLTDIARQRLAALREFSELGAGQKIALRDLELRGAGTLLGLEQSGSVAEVGLDLYLQLLERAVRRLRGKKQNPRLFSLPTVDLPISTAIPDTYIPSEQVRLRVYTGWLPFAQRQRVTDYAQDCRSATVPCHHPWRIPLRSWGCACTAAQRASRQSSRKWEAYPCKYVKATWQKHPNGLYAKAWANSLGWYPRIRSC